jgi:hypothetical protein
MVGPEAAGGTIGVWVTARAARAITQKDGTGVNLIFRTTCGAGGARISGV